MELKNIITALFGLIGVMVGGGITVAKESWFNKKKNDKESEYLSIQIVFLLEKLVSNCVDVANDDGLSYGSRDENGARREQIDILSFEPQAADVEWKVLSASLMYEILSLPGEIENCKATINAAYDHGDGGPDYNDVFEARQIGFSEIGLKALDISSRLRKLGGLPIKDYGEWSPVKLFRQKKEDIKNIQAQRQEKQAEFIKAHSPSREE